MITQCFHGNAGDVGYKLVIGGLVAVTKATSSQFVAEMYALGFPRGSHPDISMEGVSDHLNLLRLRGNFHP